MITVGQRNREWFWSKDEIKESGVYYKEWQALNEDKVDKFNPSWSYKIAFDVKDIVDNRNTELQLKGSFDGSPFSIVIKDVTVLKFIGESDETSAVISNSLIHQYIAARQRRYKSYVYFYLHENMEVVNLPDTLFWLSKSHLAELNDALSAIEQQ